MRWIESVSGRRSVCIAALLLCHAAVAAPRLVLISCDGLRPDVLTPERAPAMAALRAAGAEPAEALNDLPSATLPNHTTMLTGLTSRQHGVVLNFDLPGRVRHNTLHDYAARAGLRTAFFASKDKLEYLSKRASSEVIDIDDDQAALVGRLIAQLSPAGPDLIFLHLREADSVGHADGWMSEEYMAAVRFVDEQVGRIVEAIRADARPTYLLVTADHGGRGKNHFENIPENRRIPWVITGPDVPAGGRMALSVTQMDTLPTALWLLGVEPPGGLAGRIITEVKTAQPRRADAGDSQEQPGGGGDLAGDALAAGDGHATSDAYAAGESALSAAALGAPCMLFAGPLVLGAAVLSRRVGGARPR